MSPSTDLRETRAFAAEVKFVVPPVTAEKIRDWARARLSPDPHAASGSTGEADGYQITSLYFDTEQFAVFHRKGSFARSKYRIRRYGASETVFLERKLKTRGLVTKRRSAVAMQDLERLNGSPSERGWPGSWYHQRLLARRLRPVCQISYRRTARVSLTSHGPIRLTIDEHVHAAPISGLHFNRTIPGALLSPNQAIIELKYRLEMPLLFCRLVDEFALQPQPVSKYRLAVGALDLVPRPKALHSENACATSNCLAS